MVTARLTGNIWATRKSDLLSGYKLLLAEVIGGTRAGESMVVIDTIGAGIGDRVIGGGNPVLIQSMCNTKTEDVEATVAQTLKLEAALRL